MVEKANWMKIKSTEVEALVLDLAKKNTPAEKIGLILRDQHGIPKARLITNKKVGKILKENKINANSESENIERNIDNLKKHLEKNKHDYTAKQKLSQKLAHLRKINN